MLLLLLLRLRVDVYNIGKATFLLFLSPLVLTRPATDDCHPLPTVA